MKLRSTHSFCNNLEYSLFREYKKYPDTKHAADEDIGDGPSCHAQLDQFEGFEAKRGEGAESATDPDHDEASVMVGDLLSRFITRQEQGKYQAAHEVGAQGGKRQAERCF